ncbi:MAG: FAD-binding protein [Actinobacteria bacterium]|nr:FAD-binding protein [Actinomycetota bacterium]
MALRDELAGITSVLDGPASAYLNDSTEIRGLHGRADAVVAPSSVDEVARLLAWCYENGVPLIPRGGGTGYAGGAVPLDGGVVLTLERLNRVRSFDPLLWRMFVEAGVTTGDVRRLAREQGLMFPPDPGGAEQSQIGGNIATNAGGPHAFKYGVTGKWVTGLEAVVPPGEVITVGGPTRKDAAGYDLKSLLIGSEGTLGIVTAAWLRLVPAPEAAFPVAAFYDGIGAGCSAILSILGSGLEVATIEYLDGGTLEAAGASFPVEMPRGAGFLVIAEADGSASEAARLRDETAAVLGEGALAVTAASSPDEIAALWRWRDGVTFAVTALMGAKVSEDIAVPLDRIEEAIAETLEIGRRHGLPACSWGHAGDGNLHSTFLLAPGDPEALARASRATDDLLEMAIRLGGTVSGEHGLGVIRSGWLSRQWGARAVELHAEIKQVFDPKGLLNPGKKTA